MTNGASQSRGAGAERPARYGQLIGIVRELRPPVILEVGTWRGDRALEMLRASPASRYIGFDLFEEADAESDRLEFNVKSHYSEARVKARLRGYRVELIRGNTRSTLPRYAAGKEPFVDLAYIDGGHSVDTIRSDWESVSRIVRPGGTVLFDDYYSGMSGEKIDRVGCNRVVDSLPGLEVLPLRDAVLGGGFVRMVRVRIPS